MRPLHGVVSASGTAYAYDAAGDRTNAGSATNLLWDAERRLTGWTSGSGATTATAAYDGEGQRVAVQTITTSAPPPTPGRVKPLGPVGSTSTTSTTYYVLSLEDVTGGGITKYLGAGAGLPSAVRVGTTLSYLAVDGIGSVTEALDTSGNVTAQQLYAPYGRVRYQVGTLPTTKGYAGQRQDASSGLNDDAARYYDASTAQFASADTASDAGNGLDRLAYVGGNPETLTDPTGHRMTSGDGGDGGDSETDPTCNQAGCTSDDGVVKVDPNAGDGTGRATYNFTCNCVASVVVGPPTVTRSTDPAKPDVWNWGNSENGAFALVFAGQSLRALINLDQQILDAMSEFGPEWWLTKAGDAIAASFMALIGFAVGGPAGVVIGAGGGTLGVAIVEGFEQLHHDDVKKGMAQLQALADEGGTAIYVGSIFHGKASGPGFTLGLTGFYTDSVSAELAAGQMLAQNCADYYAANPVSPWVNSSPGIPSTTPPSPVAGCGG